MAGRGGRLTPQPSFVLDDRLPPEAHLDRYVAFALLARTRRRRTEEMLLIVFLLTSSQATRASASHACCITSSMTGVRCLSPRLPTKETLTRSQTAVRDPSPHTIGPPTPSLHLPGLADLLLLQASDSPRP